MLMSKKNFDQKLIVAIVFFLLAIPAIIYSFFLLQQGKNPISPSFLTIKSLPTPTPINFWKTYINEKYGFTLSYPAKGIVQGEKETFEGECGKAIKETTHEITFDNFFAIKIIAWKDSIDNYLISRGAKNQYEFEKILTANADEAVKVGNLKKGVEYAIGYPPLMYISHLFKKADRLFLFVDLQNPSNIGGCLPFSSLDPLKLKNLKPDIQKTFKFTP